jgi:tetratricopeptide (TPR) repeat protein
MDERLYRFLKYTAISLTLLWAGWMAYDSFFSGSQPGEYAYHAGTNFFADGNYKQALKEYEAALSEDPEYLPALRGRAEALIMLDRESEAIESYDELIARQPDNAGHYANRGIAYDRLGEYENALANYEKSLSLDAEVGEGPGWLTRFFRKQAEKPPGIPERAGYLRAQLALPPAERVLRIPEQDAAQRPYKK